MMAGVPPLPTGVLRRICEVLGDTETGLTGREIAALLQEAGINDPGEMTKRDRLFEKGLADRLRSLSGLSEDGTALVDRALGRSGSFPIVALNKLESRTDQSEHDGYANMLRGLFGTSKSTQA